MVGKHRTTSRKVIGPPVEAGRNDGATAKVALLLVVDDDVAVGFALFIGAFA